MDCRDKILSDDYVDIVVDFPVDILMTEGSDICYIPLGEGYSVIYDKLLTAQNRWRGPYQYRFTPKVYGLMELDIGSTDSKGQVRAAQLASDRIVAQEPFDPTPLISSGILSVQRDPLNLTGRGCIFCCIDTGERVILLLG